MIQVLQMHKLQKQKEIIFIMMVCCYLYYVNIMMIGVVEICTRFFTGNVVPRSKNIDSHRQRVFTFNTSSGFYGAD